MRLNEQCNDYAVQEKCNITVSSVFPDTESGFRLAEKQCSQEGRTAFNAPWKERACISDGPAIHRWHARRIATRQQGGPKEPETRNRLAPV
jgi:hypothetical protein